MNDGTEKKLLVLLLSSKEGHENLGRALHALLYAKQAREAGIETRLIFDGAGTEWALEMANEENRLHPLYHQLMEEEVILGVCQFCAKAFQVADELNALHATFLGEADGHPDVGGFAAEGYQLLAI